MTNIHFNITYLQDNYLGTYVSMNKFMTDTQMVAMLTYLCTLCFLLRASDRSSNVQRRKCRILPFTCNCPVTSAPWVCFHDRINTQLIYRFELAQVVARRITKPQRKYFRFESYWLLFFYSFYLFLFSRGGGCLILLFSSCLIFLFLFILYYFLSL